MSYVDIGIFVMLALCVIIGVKRGVIKGLVKTLGFIVVSILAFVLKDMLANWLMSFMPFFNFAGIYENALSINIMFYGAVSFVIVYILLYCVLNIIMALGKIFERIYGLKLILPFPDKLFGGILGFIEGVLICFVMLYVLCLLPNTQEFVFESRFGRPILERTPIVRTLVAPAINATEETYKAALKYKGKTMDEDTKYVFNISVLQILIKYQLISKEQVIEIEDSGKLGFDNVTFG